MDKEPINVEQIWKKEFIHWITLKPIFRKRSIEFIKNDKLHNVEFPAIIHLRKNGKFKSMSYYRDDKIYSENGIVNIRYHESGRVSHIEYYKGFRKIPPSLDDCFDRNSTKYTREINYYKNGKIKYKRYDSYPNLIIPSYVGFYKNGKLRYVKYDDVPKSWKYAYITYYKSGNVKHLSRITKNTSTKPYVNKSFYEDGTIQSKSYLRDIEYYRKDGPVVVNYYPNGAIKMERYRMVTVKYYNSGTKKSEKYYVHDTPTSISFDKKIKYDEDERNLEKKNSFPNNIFENG